MKMTFQKLVIGASMAIGVSALASTPAHAVSFEFNNTGEINTYTGTSKGTFIRGNAQGGTNAAIKALTDNDLSSNVELWYSSEKPGSNVDFTAKEGKYEATVSSVTGDDWKAFGSQWLGDLLSTYTEFQSTWKGFSELTKSSVANSFASLGMGDPNIGNFQFGENGGVELKLLGHLDVKSKLSQTVDLNVNQTWNNNPVLKALFPGQTNQPSASLVKTKIDLLKPALNSPTTLAVMKETKATLQAKINALTSFYEVLTLQATLKSYEGKIGASEVAKVVTGGQTYYAYSFKSTASEITASDDGASYSGIYTWNTPSYIAPKPPSTPVPEPSAILGLLGVAGVFATRRQLKKVSI